MTTSGWEQFKPDRIADLEIGWDAYTKPVVSESKNDGYWDKLQPKGPDWQPKTDKRAQTEPFDDVLGAVSRAVLDIKFDQLGYFQHCLTVLQRQVEIR